MWWDIAGFPSRSGWIGLDLTSSAGNSVKHSEGLFVSEALFLFRIRPCGGILRNFPRKVDGPKIGWIGLDLTSSAGNSVKHSESRFS